LFIPVSFGTGGDGCANPLYALSDSVEILPDSPNWLPYCEDDRMVPVGWLNPSEDFDRGEVSHEFVAALFRLLLNPWQPGIAMGFHSCPFCRFSGGPSSFSMLESNDSVTLGRDNVYVPADGRVFVAPSLVIHYIDAHQYRPPDDFQAAVLNCPEMRSMAYLKALRANAPESLTRVGRTP
jgi:hypothetical protein